MAAVTQGDIKFKIEFDRANVDGPIFKFTDQTIYEDPSAVKGAIRVEYNGVVLWDNLSNIETDPDIDGNSAGQVNGALTRANTQPTPLSLPLAYNDTIVNGEYTITYSLRESGESVITNTVTLDYLFELPEGSISSLVDLTLTSPSITVVDNTNYTYNNITPTGIPTLKLYYPADVDLPEVSVEASQLIVTSFYTGSQVGVLEASKAWNYSSLISDTTFTIGNVTVYSNDVVTDRINIPVEANGDICTIFCCMKDFGARLYQAKSSPTKYAQLSAIAGQVAFYFSSITAAYECGKTENVNLWVNEIRSLVDCNEDCDCDGATPILISPINGETVGYSLSVNDGSTDVSNVTEISFQGASVTNDENGQVTVVIENSPTLTVTDGDTTVNTVDNITFTGATVTDDGSGDITVAIESVPFTFESNIIVSLSDGKTFGKYQTGETIPSLGKTAIEVIQMANVEALAPTITLTSGTTIQFNQTAISNVLNFTKVINSLGASIATLSLEWRRNNAGAWVELESATAATSFTHALTDTAFNAQPFNYRLTVTDSAGGTATVYKDIAPTAYLTPTISIGAGSTSRYLGDTDSTVAGSVIRRSPLVDILTYDVQYSTDGGSIWTSINGSAEPMAAAGAGYSKAHSDVALLNETSIKYRVQIVDAYQTTTSSVVTINFYHKSFLGYNANTTITLTQIEALGNDLITNQKERTVTGVTAGVGLYTYYVYAASDGDLSVILVDGVENIFGAFTKLTDVTGLNSNGATVTYRIYRSNSTQAFTSNSLQFS
jgi:hypothetical protein